VRIVRASWNADFLKELEAFPLGKHDDGADALSGAYSILRASSGIGFIAIPKLSRRGTLIQARELHGKRELIGL
jgi:hypothetical protein